MEKQNIFIKDLRIQIIRKDLIRIERQFNSCFCDKNTFFIPNRPNFEKVETNVVEKNKYIYIYFDNKVIKVNKFDTSDVVLKKDNKIIYRFKVIENSGELPKSYNTPEVFALNDAPHIFVPKKGYTSNTEEDYIVEENEFDIYLMIINKNHKLLREKYIELTGRSELPTFKTLGLWHSRYYKYDQEQAIEMMDSFSRYDLPLDNFVIDTDWRKANDIGIGYEIDNILFPDMRSVFKHAHENNINVMFNDHPEPFKKIHNVFSKEEINFRESNLQRLLSLGLDIWRYDRNWITKLISPTPRIEPETLGMYLFHSITENHFKKSKNNFHRRPVIMGNVNNVSNGNYVKINDSASHRYPIQWTGDISCDRSSISKEISNLINGCENEVSYIHFDGGGHVGDPSKELYLDWIKFATFTPVFRLHCTNIVKRFREPWQYDQETVEIFKEYINIRYRLLTYLYSLCFKNYSMGEPVFKSLSYDYKNTKNLRSVDRQYLMGSKIMVAPNGGEIGHVIKQKNYKNAAKAQYFNNISLQGEPVLTKEYSEINFVWNHEAPEKNVNIYNFSAIFETTIEFDSNTDLYVRSDDGVRVYVDDKLMVDDWTYHGALENFVISCERNRAYNIKIEYLQGGGEATLQLVGVKKKNKEKIVIPEGNWIDLFDGKIYTKNDKPIKRTGLKDISLFVKEGSVIPLNKTAKRTDDILNDNFLILECYPSLTELDSDFIYEDDGYSVAYKKGIYRTTNYLSYYNSSNNSYVLKFNESHGLFTNSISTRDIMIKFLMLKDFKKVKEVKINGELVDFEIYKKDANIYPFSEEKTSNISDTAIIEAKFDINKSYVVEIFFEN